MQRVFVSALAGCAVAIGWADTAYTAFPGQNGKIVFESTRDGGGSVYQVYVMQPDGSGQTRLTDGLGNHSGASSPDGSKIAFVSGRDGNAEIYLMNSDGSDQVRVTNDPGSDSLPAWSPDGSKIAFQSTRDGTSQIYVMNSDGSDQTKITGGTQPAWSPDGSRIAFMRFINDTDDTEIYSMNPDGSDQRNLTNEPSFDDQQPNWSPDGQFIAFASDECIGCGPERPEFAVYVMTKDGLLPRRLSSGERPAWSPDGSKIAFSWGVQGRNAYTINADGSGVTRLTNDPRGIASVPTDWQPVLAGYPRPKGATPLRVPLVPAYNPCTAPNRVHGPPLAFPSCSPPASSSSQLTIGSADANGQATRSIGSVTLRVVAGDPATPADEADVAIETSLTDVRLVDTLADYTGELQVASEVRITDRANGTFQHEPATVSDMDYTAIVPCTASADTGTGATCSLMTSFDALTPGAIKEGKRAVWQLDRLRVSDGGADGLASTTPNTLFATQGVFIP